MWRADGGGSRVKLLVDVGDACGRQVRVGIMLQTLMLLRGVVMWRALLLATNLGWAWTWTWAWTWAWENY